MQILIKAAISLFIVFFATGIGRKHPSLAGLIGVMPLIGLQVLFWMHVENHGDPVVMQRFSRGAFLGLIPTFLFFGVAYVCFKKAFPLPAVLFLSFSAWAAAAVLHQWVFK